MMIAFIIAAVGFALMRQSMPPPSPQVTGYPSIPIPIYTDTSPVAATMPPPVSPVLLNQMPFKPVPVIPQNLVTGTPTGTLTQVTERGTFFTPTSFGTRRMLA